MEKVQELGLTHRNLKEKAGKMATQEALGIDSLFHVSQKGTYQGPTTWKQGGNWFSSSLTVDLKDKEVHSYGVS